MAIKIFEREQSLFKNGDVLQSVILSPNNEGDTLMSERIIDSICNVYIPVKDLNEGIHWCTEKLGFQLLFKETTGRFAAMKVDPAPTSPGFLIV